MDPPAEAAAPAAEPQSPPPAGESGRPGQPDRARIDRAMNAFMRGELDPSAVTSKPAEAAAPGEPAPAAEAGDVEAGSAAPERGPDGRFLPRRGAAERIAELERQLAERDPERLRQQWETERATREATDADEQQARADAERYERLRDVPDRDLSDEDYRWREERKALLAQFPKARQAMRAEAARAIEAERLGLLNHVATEISARAAKYGIDPKRWGPDSGATFGSMADDIAEAVASPLKERIAELERELHAARTTGPNGIGTLRVPALNGRSGGAAPARTVNDWLRGR